MVQKLDILTGVQESNDYPYGRLKCHITFEVEFKAGFGYRFKTQTTNPKTNRVNKPKYSTYAPFMVMHRDDNGHIKPFGLRIMGYDDVDNFIKFLEVNEVTFTDEESQELWAHLIAVGRSNAMYTRLKEGVQIEELLTALKAKEMIQCYKDHKDINEVKNIGFDLEAILSLKEVR